ncbi:MAG: hypothetical protein ACKV2O_01710 [Acidimicrobiales bacterium]
MTRMERWRVRARRSIIVLSAFCLGVAALTGYLVNEALGADPPPTINITSPTNGGAYRTATWTGSIAGTATDADGVASVQVALFQQATGRYWNGSTFASTTITFNAAIGTTGWSYPIGALPDGQYTASVRATDVTGFSTSAGSETRAVFVLDNSVPVAPTLSSSPPSSTRDTTATFSFRHSDRTVAFTCRLDGGPLAACDGPVARDGLGTVTYNDLSIARHCFAVLATDPAGNVSAARQYCWTVTPAAASIVVFGGNDQDTFLDTAYQTPLQARVADAQGRAQIGLAVTFTAPSSGASGRFNSAGCPNTLTCTVITGANGVAQAPPFVANNVAGAFSVNATVVPVTTPARFSLFNAARFHISGDVTNPLYPGTGQAVELSFTNPNPAEITIASGVIGITIVVDPPHGVSCPASPNFAVAKTLTAAVTIPANRTSPISLTDLGVPVAAWPRIDMVETGVNQDACKNASLSLFYTAGANG